MKTTPGPWTTDTPNSNGMYVFADDITVAACDFAPGSETCRANARLVAAAPDLLAACESALHYLNRNDYTDADISGLCTALRDAIAKASGR